MKARICRWLATTHRWLAPPRPIVVRDPAEVLAAAQAQESAQRAEYIHRCCELIEARQMCGSGPWLVSEAREFVGTPKLATALRESNAISSQGAFGDIELALQNVEWRRELNMTALEFSRWGIQQIMLICRLYYIKNPIIRRLINVTAEYVFARGVEVSSPDDDANETLKEFFEANKSVLGQNALIDLEKRKDYDGNLFFCLFADKMNRGSVTVRMIDAMEIQEIVTDPDDAVKPWFYRRIWTQRNFDEATGQVSIVTREAYYPALGYEPANQPPTIGGKPVMWDSPVYHRKDGHVASWQFGCPRAYPAMDWARASKDWLTACATVKQALAQIALSITTKGGQQAVEGVKAQLQTQVGPGGGQSLWDSNPTAVTGSTFVSGTGTKLEAFKTTGAGGNPEEVRQYKLMCCMVFGVPETFLGDVSTGNLATATSLDRPTETNFIAKQEAWVEDLTTIAQYVLRVSAGAPKGKLREAIERRTLNGVRVLEMARTRDNRGRPIWQPLPEAARTQGKDAQVEVMVNFPAIREGDIPALVTAVVQAMTLENKGGQIVGIDEKEGVRKLFKLLDIDGADEIVDEMYPDSYDADRTKQVEPAPIGRTEPNPGGQPQLPGGKQVAPADQKVEAAVRKLSSAVRAMEALQRVS